MDNPNDQLSEFHAGSVSSNPPATSACLISHQAPISEKVAENLGAVRLEQREVVSPSGKCLSPEYFLMIWNYHCLTPRAAKVGGCGSAGSRSGRTGGGTVEKGGPR